MPIKLHVKSKFSNLKKKFSNEKASKLYVIELQFTCNLRHNKTFFCFHMNFILSY